MIAMEVDQHARIRAITENGIIAGLYYGLTMLFILVPAVGQFGVIQCRFSEILVLLVFFKPRLVWGLTLGCFLANMTGAIAGQNLPIDMLFGTLATFVSCLGIAYFSRFLCVGLIYPIVINAVVVGLEWYLISNDGGYTVWACMGIIGAGEAVAIIIGYLVMLLIMRNKGAMKALGPTRHIDAKF